MSRFGGPVLRCCGAKTFIDGTPLGHTGYMLKDYSDLPGTRGTPLINPDDFIRSVCLFHTEQIPVRVHACGDAGVRLSLDAFETAVKNRKEKGPRHAVEHIEVASPEDIVRMGKLGIVASVQPEHMPKYDFVEHPFHRILGRERMAYCWPFGSLRKSGAPLAFGTDYPVADLNPLRGIFRAVNRKTNEGEPAGGWNPGEKLTVHEALQAYTLGGAFAAGRDRELGTLEPGKLADIAVLEESPFEQIRDRDAMFSMSVLLTVMDGRIVYRKD